MNIQQKNQAYFNRMSEIIELFNGNDFQDKLEKKQEILLKKTSNILKSFRSDSFLDNFEPVYHDQWSDFLETGIVKGSDLSQAISNLKAILTIQTRNLSDLFRDFEIRWKDSTPSCMLADDINLEEELTLLNILYPYNVELGGWMLPDFTLTPDNPDDHREQTFSGLCLCLNFTEKNSKDAVTIKADNKKATIVQNGYFHPHVSCSGLVCWGAGEDAANKHWHNKRLLAFFHNICAIFGTYNSNSPYEVLESWINLETYFCSNCGIKIYDDTTFFIDGDTEIPACRQCCAELGRNSGVYKWKHELVWSNLRQENILKRDASKVWIDDKTQDYLPNLLSNPNFSMCQGGCFHFVHNDYLSQVEGKSLCIRCLRKHEDHSKNSC